MREGADLDEVGGERIGSVVEIDPAIGRAVIKKMMAKRDYHATSLQTVGVIPAIPVEPSLLSMARDVAEHGFAMGGFRAAKDLLLQNGPCVVGTRSDDRQQRPLLSRGEETVEGTLRLVRSLEASVLPVQGPPGTGKTFTAARVIATLAQTHRVGITAVSHKVIRNLLDEIQVASAEAGASLRIVQKGDPEDEDPAWLDVMKKNQDALAAVDAGTVVGGTVWLWSRDDARETLDYLFVDEAGQMSLAHVLAASQSARNLVLLGDPQQLQQPQRGAHPEGAEVSALSHLLGGAKTLPPDRGVFLETTWRLPPSICSFTSELYYESRLQPRDGLAHQAVIGGGQEASAIPASHSFPENGLIYVPVPHERNQSRSEEEVEAVARLVEFLTRSGIRWRAFNHSSGRSESPRPLELGDILIVAPYNAQVGALIGRLPNGARVGTVDRFQGQEAPVVIYSMTSSSAEDAPRGTEFLFDPNRMNVATSRARGLCFLVASPGVMDTECRTPEQMKRANGVCRFVEMATEWFDVPEGTLS
ncbi:MAG: AAA family ATPase [Candidatus Eisenbacteria bacterium]|uniref:AAA family ATPase n=1 Tax=Eiseniibacteriota bacterium TaxID=2212470 RepID=A0A956NHV9_UNCEI|nr:AAA family ATPase [Candidatus Eisenbacteria bacterium]